MINGSHEYPGTLHEASSLSQNEGNWILNKEKQLQKRRCLIADNANTKFETNVTFHCVHLIQIDETFIKNSTHYNEHSLGGPRFIAKCREYNLESVITNYTNKEFETKVTFHDMKLI